MDDPYQVWVNVEPDNLKPYTPIPSLKTLFSLVLFCRLDIVHSEVKENKGDDDLNIKYNIDDDDYMNMKQGVRKKNNAIYAHCEIVF